jgi:hypothetical protein
VTNQGGGVSQPDANARRHLDTIAKLTSQMATSEPDAITRVNMTRRLQAAGERLLRDTVRAARREGATWQQIGDQLGVPRQTAHRRYGPH